MNDIAPSIPSERQIHAFVDALSIGMRELLRAQLRLLANDLRRAGYAETFVRSAMKALIDEIRAAQT
jgi:hypothetical protein